jgi:hypothetical protein
VTWVSLVCYASEEINLTNISGLTPKNQSLVMIQISSLDDEITTIQNHPQTITLFGLRY